MGPSEATADIAAPECMQGEEEEEEEKDVVRAAHCPAHRAAGSSPEGVRKRWEGRSSQEGPTAPQRSSPKGRQEGCGGAILDREAPRGPESPTLSSERRLRARVPWCSDGSDPTTAPLPVGAASLGIGLLGSVEFPPRPRFLGP